MRKLPPLGCAFALSLVGCSGAIESVPVPGGQGSAVVPSKLGEGATPGTETGQTAPGQTVPGKVAAPLTCSKRAVGDAPFRRLTKAQYARTVEDLLGVVPDVSGFPADDSSHGFEVGLNVSSLLVESYSDAATTVAAKVELKKVLPCDPVQGEEACARRFVDEFSRRALRRATSEAERTALLAVYGAGRSGQSFESGVRLVIETLLQSPSFVYHVDKSEGSDGDGLRKLTPYALANRLSYLVWGSMPDVALLDAAAAGKLASADGLEAELRRMSSARPEAGRRGFRDFYRQWLSLDALDTMERDKARYPEFTRSLASDLGESLTRQIDATVWDEQGDVEALLLGRDAYVNAAVAPLFGLTAKDATFSKVVLDATERRGILTHPALLGVLSKPNQSDPVIRGRFVRERLLCQPLPPPPANVATVPPDPAPGLTTRQRFSEHATNASCTGCHKLMDPIGFGLEHFDALGRHRMTDEGVAVDARGEIVSSVDADGPFDGAVELAERLADSKAVRDCVATQYFRFALSRTETTADSCSLVSTFEHFEGRGGALSELLVAVVKSDAFRYLAPTEVQP